MLSKGIYTRENILFVILGDKCNMNCRYCIKKEHNNHIKIDNDISDEVVAFINDFDGVIFFYGGEPLLYYQEIVSIITRCGRDKKFALMTNGFLLNESRVNFFNKYRVSVKVSWDGVNCRLSRGHDVVLANWNLISRLDDLWIVSVVSRYNYPLDVFKSLQGIDDMYYDIHHEHIKISVAPVIKTFEHEVFEMDLKRVSEEMAAVLGSDSFIARHYKVFINKYASKFDNSPGYIKKCGSGFQNVAIDLQGNLYICKNGDKVIGTINDIDRYCELVLRNDCCLDKSCLDCCISVVCQGGCRNNIDRDHFCDLQRAFYKPVLDYIYGK